VKPAGKAKATIARIGRDSQNPPNSAGVLCYCVNCTVGAGVNRQRWLGPESRCVVPFTTFSEDETLPDGRKPPIWFAFNASRPLACFAGIWTRWTTVRNVKEGETTNDLFAFLTTEPNALVGAYHPKAMPVILWSQEEIDLWMTAPSVEALQFQWPLTDDALMVVARGSKQDS
jgi:putative SOS response-associated peptidase YedK